MNISIKISLSLSLFLHAQFRKEFNINYVRRTSHINKNSRNIKFGNGHSDDDVEYFIGNSSYILEWIFHGFLMRKVPCWDQRTTFTPFFSLWFTWTKIWWWEPSNDEFNKVITPWDESYKGLLPFSLIFIFYVVSSFTSVFNGFK